LRTLGLVRLRGGAHTKVPVASYLKTASRDPVPVDRRVAEVVSEILLDVERRGEAAVREYSARLDSWSPARFTVSSAALAETRKAVPLELRRHIDFAADQIRRFALAQRESMSDIEVEPLPGITLGHRHVPVDAVGAYSPGGRYPLIASSLMTSVVPKVAGVGRVVACAPPYNGAGIAPAMLYAMDLGGADEIVCVGGAHGIAALVFGIEEIEPVDMIVGAGNAYVAEAKRQLFGKVGIDLLAGPTEILIIADDSADPDLIASDLVGQLEHGPTSVGWLLATSESVAAQAIESVEKRLVDIPTREVAREAWEGYGQVAICASDQEAVVMADRLAAEHVEVHTRQPEWYLERLSNYGSLFLGDETTVPYGDKGIGTNHVLPTAGAARYTGGLWVGKFLKTLTYQSATKAGTDEIAPTIVAICEAEQLPGHARSAQDRLDRVHQRA
jgi:sulfopropanediol 3-dehydrogenase